jgi:hypothetical protein
MPKEPPPTFSEIIQELLLDLDGPIPVDEFIDRFLEIRVPGSKNPRASVRRKLKEENGWLLVFLDRDHILPIEFGYQAIRFRIKLTRMMLYKGLLPLAEFMPYLSWNSDPTDVAFLDEDGSALRVKVIKLTRTVQSPLGPYDHESLHVNLKKWFKERKAKNGDYVLVTLDSYAPKKFLLEVEPKGNVDQELLQARNKQLADIFFDLLEDSQHEIVYSRIGIPTAYARLPDKGGYPPDSLTTIIEDDPRMVLDGWDIRYSDAPPGLFERILADDLGIPLTPPAEQVSKERGEQVYRFKAALKYRKALWRVIEIQGAQTLADFNRELMRAFKHDWDHMGGFWKMVPRAGSRKRKKYREVDLGSVNPFGEGAGAEKQIAGLDLKSSDRLKYVYDFGDWIEHEITLEEIVPPEPGVTYPRIADQNKPRYRYCESCRERDRKTRAVWICLSCSGREQRDVLICEECLDRDHQDHFAEEYLY